MKTWINYLDIYQSSCFATANGQKRQKTSSGLSGTSSRSSTGLLSQVGIRCSWGKRGIGALTDVSGCFSLTCRKGFLEAGVPVFVRGMGGPGAPHVYRFERYAMLSHWSHHKG